MHFLPSWMFYPLLLAGIFWVFAPPLAGVLGFGEALVRRRTPVGRLALLILVGQLAFFLPYEYQAARFMAPAALTLTVLAAAAIPDFIERRRAREGPGEKDTTVSTPDRTGRRSAFVESPARQEKGETSTIS
jgi:hypothetical protein